MDAFLGLIPALVKDWGPAGFVIIIVVGILVVIRHEARANTASAEKLRADHETTITRKNSELEASYKRIEYLEGRVAYWYDRWKNLAGVDEHEKAGGPE